MVKTEVFATLPVSVTVPVFTVRAVESVAFVTVPAFPVTLPEIALVTVRSVNHPFTKRVPVLPIWPLESVARIDAAAPGADEDVMAWVWAVAVLLEDDTVSVPGVAMVAAPVLASVNAPDTETGA